MCKYTYMKINIKTATLISFLLGTLFYLLSNKKISNIQLIKIPQPNITVIDKKSTELAAPKPLYCVAPDEKKLGLGNNWKSKK